VLHGQELQFLTNHVGHFLLVTGLLDRLADDGRVVVLSSTAHRNAPREGICFDDLSLAKRYSPWASYGQSKFANLLFAKELARRLQGTRKTANAVHPGVIATNLARHMNPIARAAFSIAIPLVLKSVGEGAATQTYVAVNPGAATITGKYWQDCNVAAPRPDAEDAALATRLWEVTEKIVAAL
jgi:WW domain-containing oxidoreductase